MYVKKIVAFVLKGLGTAIVNPCAKTMRHFFLGKKEATNQCYVAAHFDYNYIR